MNASASRLASPAPRLIEAARRISGAGAGAGSEAPPRIVGLTADGSDPRAALEGAGSGDRILVLGWIGIHPDARPASLRLLWDLEERARATGARVLAMRLGPLVGPASPLMAWLARRPRLDAALARALVQPVLESDVVSSLARALAGTVAWEGWYEVCGPEPMAVEELAVLAGSGEWLAAPACEPSPEVLRSQGISEWEPWGRAFGLVPGPVTGGAVHGVPG